MAMFAAQPDGDGAGTGCRGLRLRGHRDPVLPAVPRHRQHHRRARRSAWPRPVAVGRARRLLQGPGGWPDGLCQRIDVFSWVGIIPLFACEIVDQRLLAQRAALRGDPQRARRRAVRRPHHLPVPGARQRARRASAGPGGPHHAAAPAAAAARRTRVPVALRHSQRLAHPCRASGPGSHRRHRPGADRVRARRVATRACSAATPTGADRSGCRPTTR
ncbi:MAG: hypothetical protein MZW92_68305 [Comamonadaceae bacterium]|nr:hypothetical protein [Comamonadaceae bacterium]